MIFMKEYIQMNFNVFTFIEILYVVSPMFLALRILLNQAVLHVKSNVVLMVLANYNSCQAAKPAFTTLPTVFQVAWIEYNRVICTSRTFKKKTLVLITFRKLSLTMLIIPMLLVF